VLTVPLAAPQSIQRYIAKDALSPPQSRTTRVRGKRKDAKHNGRDHDQGDEASKHAVVVTQAPHFGNFDLSLRLPPVPNLRFCAAIQVNKRVYLQRCPSAPNNWLVA
jgi:hypothetical protein